MPVASIRSFQEGTAPTSPLPITPIRPPSCAEPTAMMALAGRAPADIGSERPNNSRCHAASNPAATTPAGTWQSLTQFVRRQPSLMSRNDTPNSSRPNSSRTNAMFVMGLMLAMAVGTASYLTAKNSASANLAWEEHHKRLSEAIAQNTAEIASVKAEVDRMSDEVARTAANLAEAQAQAIAVFDTLMQDRELAVPNTLTVPVSMDQNDSVPSREEGTCQAEIPFGWIEIETGSAELASTCKAYQEMEMTVTAVLWRGTGDE